MAGSDDGKIFFWDRKSTNIIKVLKGDDSIVNCLQPHPDCCVLASSGIDHVVRLWSPQPEVQTYLANQGSVCFISLVYFSQDGSKNAREIQDLDKTVCANQRRMNADPFESFLMEMRELGYPIRGKKMCSCYAAVM